MSFYMPHLCGNAKEEDLLEKSHKQAVLNIAKLILKTDYYKYLLK